MQQRERIEAILFEGLRAHRTSTRISCALVGLLVGPLGAYGAMLGATPFDREIVGALVLAILAVPVGVALATLRDPQNNDVIRTLRQHANEIVWVYVSRGSAGRFVWLWTLDGRAHSTAVPLKNWSSTEPPSEKEHELMSLLAAALPHATFGFSPNNETAFRADPARLRRS